MLQCNGFDILSVLGKEHEQNALRAMGQARHGGLAARVALALILAMHRIQGLAIDRILARDT